MYKFWDSTILPIETSKPAIWVKQMPVFNHHPSSFYKH